MPTDATTATLRSATRRRLLTSGGSLCLLGVFSGCTALPGTGSGPHDSDASGTEDLPARLRLATVSSPDCEAADPIDYAALSSDEQALVDEAIETDEYAVPTDETPPAFDAFRDRVEARSDTCGELVVYLRRGETYYRVGLVDGDHIIATTDRASDS